MLRSRQTKTVSNHRTSFDSLLDNCPPSFLYSPRLTSTTNLSPKSTARISFPSRCNPQCTDDILEQAPVEGNVILSVYTISSPSCTCDASTHDTKSLSTRSTVHNEYHTPHTLNHSPRPQQRHAPAHESVLPEFIDATSCSARRNRVHHHNRHRHRRHRSSLHRRQSEVINGRWKLGKRLGSGGFGTVYAARHLRTGAAVAVKLSRTRGADTALEMENAVYRAIGRMGEEESAGIARQYYFGRHGKYDVLVMERLGLSLESVVRRNGGGLCTKSVLMVGIQALRRLQIVHEAGFLHRDVKPDNLMTGLNDVERIYLVDFGLAKRVRRSGRRGPIGLRKREFVGTLRFASARAHWRAELDRSDDLMSLGYSLVYLFYGRLPWQSVGRRRGVSFEQRSEMVGRVKREIAIEGLLGHMPREFYEYFEYMGQLQFGEKPDYTYLRNLFRMALQRKGMKDDRSFEWTGA